MTTPAKPTGYTSVSPYLIVDDAKLVIEFLKQTFDATELRRYDNPDGSIMHMELRQFKQKAPCFISGMHPTKPT